MKQIPGFAVLAMLLILKGTACAADAVLPVTAITFIDIVPDIVVPQNEEKAQALLKKMNADTQEEPGLISFEVLQEAARPNHFELLETWEDQTAFAFHEAAAHTKKFRSEIQPLLGSPYDTLLTTVFK